MSDPIDHELEALRQRSAAQAAAEGEDGLPIERRPSRLPYDPTRGGDADWVMSQGMSPLEYLCLVYQGVLGYDKGRVEAAKACLPVLHSARPTRQLVEVSGDAGADLMLQALRQLRPDPTELAALKARVLGDSVTKPH